MFLRKYFFKELIMIFLFLRSSLLEVLPSLQLLDGEILTRQTEKIKTSELGTFLELCQVQIEENIQLKKKAAELEYVFMLI